ncbi:uncharacterized protein N7484_008114 [Penicillium longicatenatum]|uniref:uncharacterized protein n=1 Tax=Penicillium longicatenatum TaxID=1561947 RepID=UPI002547832A|nr:uncharacterized protein N7484_008114 [Penicillium longicatenatum]KAJ5640252.1 hypothetical protein N7484_008114 [Penicillium longicatenatum]
MTCEACRTIPPVIAHGYKPRGKYETLAGLKTYVTGKVDSQIGLVDLYDVFGFANQTLQGADLLARRLNAVVLIPDFFEGDALPHDVTPADTDTKQKILNDFRATKANVPRNVGVLMRAVEEYKTRFPSVAKWGAYGLCWGGKVTVLASGADTPFAATGQVHPGSMDTADAKALTIPHIVLASKDEPAIMVGEYASVIANGKGGLVEIYSSMWHGWMGARANLEREESRAEYTRGYTQLGEFFEKHLC